MVRFTNPWTSTRYSIGRILNFPHNYGRIYDVIHAKHKHDLIEVMNYMLKDLQSKYDRFSARQAISCDQAIRTITIDLHSLQTLKMSGILPLLPLYTFMRGLWFYHIFIIIRVHSRILFSSDPPTSMSSSYILSCSSNTELKHILFSILHIHLKITLDCTYSLIFIDLVSLKILYWYK